MRKKSAVILIQWSLGQVKRCVHVTFFHRPMRMDGKPLDPRCNGFYSCENVRSHQFLIQLCYTTIVSWSLIQWHCLLSCLVVLSRGSEVEKPNWGSEVRCRLRLLQGALWCFFPRLAESPARHTHIYNSTQSTIWSFWSGRESEETPLACFLF